MIVTKTDLRQMFTMIASAINKFEMSARLAAAEMEAIEDALIEQHGTLVRGRCDSCRKALFFGDQGYAFDDGPEFCEEHAPTYGEHKAGWEEQTEPDDVERRAKAIATVDAHIANGGSLNDRYTHEL